MRTLPAGLKPHLESGTTTLCHCWRLTLANGEKLGFTDHDRTLIFDGTTFEAQSGFTASEIESSLGLSVDNLDAAGAIESGKLDEIRLKAGDFDNAEIEIWRANWQDVTQRVLLRKGHLGEVTYGQGYFAAEIRGLSHLFQQVKGRIFTYGCDAELGDARCKVNLEQATLKGTGIVSAISGARLEASGLGAFADDWFTHGTVTWASGANQSRKFRVKRHRKIGTVARIDLWQEIAVAPSLGDQITLRAGCDRQPATCTSKFSNITNYRGFPHMPGNDFVSAVAAPGDASNDGGRRA